MTNVALPAEASHKGKVGVDMAESSKFKISVWREFVPPSAILMRGDGSATGDPSIAAREYLGRGSGLQKEVFSWRMVEDAFGGVTDVDARADLEAKLLQAFSIDAPPELRGVLALRAFIDRAREVLEAGDVEWSGSQSASDELGGEVRLNPLLALVTHLSWIADVFEEQPGVSLSRLPQMRCVDMRQRCQRSGVDWKTR
ncbi:MAG: hypothetical protein M3N07_07200 [Pseudomonadota bacterium]|nr:hypothetical protein [Pseudomonadota bacterium]